MKRRTACFFLATIIMLTACNCNWKKTVPPPIVIPKLLSFTSSASYYWQIGYSAGNTLSVDQFRLCSYADISSPIAIWHPTSASDGYYPYTGQNRDTVTRLHSSNQWAARPQQIVMEGSNTGQYSMLLLTIPADGYYKIKVVFEGVHFNLSSTDVHVLLNNTSLFSDIIEGYGGDSTVHAVTGSHPTATYSGSLLLKKSDVIIFAVGYGANKTFYNDTTGLMVTVESSS